MTGAPALKRLVADFLVDRTPLHAALRSPRETRIHGRHVATGVLRRQCRRLGSAEQGLLDVLNWAPFETAFGRCAIAWSARGVVAVQLPECDDARTVGGLLRGRPGVERAPSGFAQEAVDALVALLRDGRAELDEVPLDWQRVSPFQRDVYRVTRGVPAGATTTYGAIAARLGDAGLARAVGRTLGSNPYTLVVPCHRVLAAGGAHGGFSAHGGVATKLRLLALERALPPDAQAAGDLFEAAGRDEKGAVSDPCAPTRRQDRG